MKRGDGEKSQKTFGFLRALAAVAAAMFGVRRGARAREDWARIRPVYVIIAGVVMVALFVAGLLAVVGAVVG